MPESVSPEVQAEKLRQLIVRRLHQAYSTKGGPPVLQDGTIKHDGREYEITVEPKGLAELQARLIAEVRVIVGFTADDCNVAHCRCIDAIASAIEKYDDAPASLGSGKGGV